MDFSHNRDDEEDQRVEQTSKAVGPSRIQPPFQHEGCYLEQFLEDSIALRSISVSELRTVVREIIYARASSQDVNVLHVTKAHNEAFKKRCIHHAKGTKGGVCNGRILILVMRLR